MKLLSEIIARPSAFDSFDNYYGDVPSDTWRCLMTRNRDSEARTESNWRVALKKLGGESESVVVHRFGHWACGWWEAIAVDETSDSYALAKEIYDSLQDYPILDDEDHQELLDEQAMNIWTNCYNNKERLNYIREHRDEFEFGSISDIISQVKGRYFGGYASDLVYS
jgi:hypothetical protein